jgi:hypothetical protein
VRCPACNNNSAENVKFCIECGASLNHRCPNCAQDNLPAAKFCSECGAALTVPQPIMSEAAAGAGSSNAVEIPAEKRAGAVGERRHLTRTSSQTG